MYQLRPYQLECINKILWAKELEGNSLVSLSTGAGKSVIIAELSYRLNTNILILQPMRELLSQNYEKLTHYVDKSEIGIYSQSFQQKDIKKYTFATINSIYRNPQLFSHFKLVIIDECHLVNPKALDSMYLSFLKAIGNAQCIGLTATPYRLVQAYKPSTKPWLGRWESMTTIKLINRLQGKFWKRIIYNISLQELIDKKYLVPLSYHSTDFIAESKLSPNKSKSDYDLSAYEQLLLPEWKNIFPIIQHALSTHVSTIIFCSSIDQAEMIGRQLQIAFISSKTKPKERREIIEAFKKETIKAVCNVGILTTGFDHPSLDCIIMLRPTQSIGLYYQMLGRGVRTSPGKTHCDVIDLSGNVKRIGKIESIKLVKDDLNMWNLSTATGLWHGRELYSIYLQDVPF